MLSHVTIRNFKSLDVDVTLDPVTVLVGMSGTGKTNFVEGLRFLRDFLRGTQSLGNVPSLRSATGSEQGIVHFAVTFDLPGYSGAFSYLLELSYRGGAAGHHKERLSVGDQVIYYQENGKWVMEPHVENKPPPNNLVLTSLEGIHEVSVAHVLLTKGIACYDFPSDICKGDSKGDSLEGLSDDATNYGYAFDAITGNLHRLNAWQDINRSLKSLNPSIQGVESKRSGKKRLVVSHDFDNRRLVFDISQESEGFRRFFSHLLALYQSPPKQVMVFEEPEKGIHPGALEALAAEIKSTPENGRGQVILTTHSPTLLDFFKPESLRVVEIRNGVTSIGTVDGKQLDAVRNQLLMPGELLTVDPARLEMAQIEES